MRGGCLSASLVGNGVNHAIQHLPLVVGGDSAIIAVATFALDQLARLANRSKKGCLIFHKLFLSPPGGLLI